jgi:MFS family permease
MLLFASTPGVSLAYPLALLVGFASVWFVTASTAMMQLRSDRRMRGRVLALQAIVLIGSTPVGGPLLGYVSDLYGARAGIVLGGLAAIGAAVWGTMAARRVHRETATREGAAREASVFPTARQDAEV